MRFGGHESFAVREGWLSRGLEILCDNPSLLDDEYSEDHLGVGRNMAKAIRHWLVATELAEDGTAAGAGLRPTKFGSLVHRKDPHFLDTGTWWMLHANLIGNPPRAFSWNWFFNQWSLQRFDRAPCLEALKRFAAAKLPRAPSPKTLERDLATLLQCYARPIPARIDDPEDSAESPFQELGLVHHHAASGYYQLCFHPKPIGMHVFGYVVSMMPAAKGRSDMTIGELERSECSPGRCFLLRGDEIYDLVHRFEVLDRREFSLRSQAGERGVSIAADKRPLDWAREHYANTEVMQHG